MNLLDKIKTKINKVNNREGSAVVSVLGALTLVTIFVTGAMTYSTNLNNNISFISGIVEETSKGKFEIQSYLENMNNIADLPSYREAHGLSQEPSSTAYYSDTCTGTSYTISYGNVVSRDVCLYYGGTSTTSSVTLWSFGMASNTDIVINGTASVSAQNVYASDYVYNNSSIVYSYLRNSVYNLVEYNSIRFSLWDATTIYSDGLYSCNNSCYNYTSQVTDESDVQYEINYDGFNLDGDGYDNTLLSDTILNDWMDSIDLEEEILKILYEKSPMGDSTIPEEYRNFSTITEFFEALTTGEPWQWSSSNNALNGSCDGGCYNTDNIWSGSMTSTESTIAWLQDTYMMQYYMSQDNPEDFFMFVMDEGYDYAPTSFDGQAVFSDSITIASWGTNSWDPEVEWSGVVYVNGDVTIDMGDDELFTVDQYGNEKPLVIIATGNIIFKSYDNDRDGDNVLDAYLISGGSIIFEDPMININISGGLYSFGSEGVSTYTTETAVSDLETFDINTRYSAGTYVKYGSYPYLVLQDTIYNDITDTNYFEKQSADLTYDYNTVYGLYDVVCTTTDGECTDYYISISANNQNRGLTNTSYWKKINNLRNSEGYLIYDSSISYNQYDIVSNNGTLYVSLKSNNTGGLTNKNSWLETEIEDFVRYKIYSKGDVVLFEGNYYYARWTVYAQQNPNVNTTWVLIDNPIVEVNDAGFTVYQSGTAYTKNDVVCSSSDESVCYVANKTASSTSLNSNMWTPVETSGAPNSVLTSYKGIFITSFVGRINEIGNGQYQLFENQNLDEGIFITQSNSLVNLYASIATNGGSYNTFYDNMITLPTVEINSDSGGTSYNYLSDWY